MMSYQNLDFLLLSLLPKPILLQLLTTRVYEYSIVV